MMRVREEERGAISKTENSDQMMLVEKRAVSSEEVVASDEAVTVVPPAALASGAVVALKAIVAAQEGTMLQSQTTCFLTRISQPCEKEVLSLILRIETGSEIGALNLNE